MYVVFTICMTAAEFSPMLYFGGFGLTVVDTCFVKDGTTSYWFALIPIFINVPFNFMAFIVLKCSEGYEKNKALQKMVRACLSMCINWGYPIFTAGMKTTIGKEYYIMNYIAFLLGSSAGTILAICRLGSFEIMRRLYRSTFKKIKKPSEFEYKQSKAINEVLIEDCSVNFLFKELTLESIKEILFVFSLCLVSTSTSKSEENYSYSYRKLKHKFSEDSCKNLSNYINLSNFQLKKDHGIWEYGKNYFDSIKNSCNVTTESLLSSFSLISNFSFIQNSNSAGRSGAFIMVTFDKKFVLKIVNRQERYLLLDILPAYSKRICECPDSRIVRILGMYKITSSKHTFIIMENIVADKNKANIYDLKGSIDDRYVDTNSDSKASILKDGNFLELNESINLNKEQRERVLDALNDDLKFFTKHNIIDYSLLIAIYEEPLSLDSRYYLEGAEGYSYCLGIIDFLQEYSLNKKLELLLKRLKGKVNTSVCSSRKYSARFLTFINKSLKFEY